MKPRGSKLRHNLLHGRRMLCLLLEVDFFGIKTSSLYILYVFIKKIVF